jgi:hypothetical protein
MGMNAQDVEKYLAELGHELTSMELVEPVRVLLVGGAFISTQVSKRRTTRDIDVIVLNEQGPETGSMAVALWKATHSIANKSKLPEDWFNTIIRDYIQALGPAPIETIWQQFGLLEVYLPPQEYILLLKLTAHRDKDMADIKFLCKKLKILNRKQLQTHINSYVSDFQVQLLLGIPDVLEMLYPTS